MKKIFTLIAFVFLLPTTSKAQGDLQFSKVKLISTQDTVPSGKMWKIESFIYSQPIPNSSVNITQDASIALNGQIINIRSTRFSAPWAGTIWGCGCSVSAYGAAYEIWEQKLPIWLPAGTIVGVDIGVLYISALEFNVIP